MAHSRPPITMVVIGLVVFGTVFVGTIVFRPSPTRDAPNPFEGMVVPEFELTDHTGSTVDQSVLDGRITVLDFFFTSCPLYCPGMTGAMARVQDATVAADIRFLSIALDPAHDTPEAIGKWGEVFGADFDRWTFLTGERELTTAIATGGLLLGVSDMPNAPITRADGTTMPNIAHPTRLILLGRDRQVLGMYRYDSDEEIDRLIADAQRAAKSD